MTDEERRKLVHRLRQTAIIRDIVGIEAEAAADEIERLAAENGRLTQALIDKLAEPKAKGMPDFTKIDWNTP
jgi:HAMP domain-containing protein